MARHIGKALTYVYFLEFMLLHVLQRTGSPSPVLTVGPMQEDDDWMITHTGYTGASVFFIQTFVIINQLDSRFWGVLLLPPLPPLPLPLHLPMSSSRMRRIKGHHCNNRTHAAFIFNPFLSPRISDWGVVIGI